MTLRRPLVLLGGKPAELPQGDTLPGASGGAVPTFLADGATYSVNADTQVLFLVDIDLNGELIIDGELVEVS